MKDSSDHYQIPDFQKLFESAPGLFLVLSPDLTIVAVSDAYLAATRTIRNDILGKGLFDIFPDNPNDPTATGVQNLNASLNRVLKKKQPDTMEIQKYDIPSSESNHDKFEERYWLPLNSPVIGLNQEVQFIIHKVEDVTELVRLKQKETNSKKITKELKISSFAEKEYLKNLIEGEERFRLLVENIKDYAIFIINPEGYIVSWNKGAEHIKGYSEKEILGKHFSLFYTDEEIQKKAPEYNLEIAKKTGRFENEGWRIKKNQTKFWADVIISSLYDEEGNLRGFAKITRDITIRKNAEDLLKKSNDRFFKIFNLSPEAKSMTDITDGRFMYMNNAFERLFEIPPGEGIGKTSLELKIITPEDRTALVHRIHDKNVRSEELILHTTKGKTLHVLGQTEILEIDDKTCFLSTFIDISDRKKAEEKIDSLNKDLEKHIAQLESVNKELEAFSYSVSHDLRAPLRAIDGYARILKEDYYEKIEEEGKISLDRIMYGARKMGYLIDDLLSFSRIGRKELKKSHADINNIIDGVLAEIKNEIAQRDITFSIQQLGTCMADTGLLKQVWQNLILNAVKYTRKKEKAFIEIGMSDSDNEVIYYIKDNGTGFDMEYSGKLFGVFQRLHSEKEFEGTGVGLAIIHRIIDKHGGRVWGEGEVNKGAKFYFTLPK